MYKIIPSVKLERGCIVWRNLLCAQHTGVYLGEGKIAQVGKPGWFKGIIEKVSVKKFMDNQKRPTHLSMMILPLSRMKNLQNSPNTSSTIRLERISSIGLSEITAIGLQSAV